MKRFLASVLTLSMLLGIVGYIPAMAHEGETDSSGSQSSSSKLEQKKQELEQAREAAKQKAEEAREAAKQQLEAKKQEVEDRTEEARSKSCEARQSNIDNRLSNIVANAQKHEDKFTSIYQRVQDFATKKNLTVENATALTDAVAAAKTAVDNDIATLSELKGSVDCSNPDTVASTLSAFKDQASNLKNDLKSYRDSIRSYAQAVKKSAETALESKSSDDTAGEDR